MPSTRTLWTILFLAFILRLGGAAYWHRQAESEGRLFRLGDSDGYWVLANQIAQGEPYQYGSENARIFRAPLFPIVLAPFTYLSTQSPGVVAARAFGCALGTFAVWELMLLASRFGGATAAKWAGLIGAISPSAIGMSVIVLSEMLLVPLMLAHLLAWQNAWRASSMRPKIGWALFTGGVAGLAILARPSWLLFTPFLLSIGLLLGPNRRLHLSIGLYTLLGTCVVLTPWWIRNAQVTGKFVPTTLQVGPSLYDGLHPGASGASDEGMLFMQAIVAEQVEADQQSGEPWESTFEYRVNRRAQQLAINFAVEHPTETLRLAVAKFLRTWSLWPAGGELGSTPIRMAVTLGTFGILILAIYGSWLTGRRQGWLLTVCWLPCLYFTLLHMLFVGSVRYREPAVFVLAAVAGCAIADLASRLRHRIRTNHSVLGPHASANEPS